MEMRELGAGGMRVGVIGMGTWRTFDVVPNNGAAMRIRREIVDEALSCDVNLFDSSPMYGSAEEVLALALDGRRSQAVVATKVWSSSVREGRQQIDQALAWYGGRVDIYQVHNLVQWREYLPILQELKAAGKVGTVGVTHYAHSAFRDIVRIMEMQDIGEIQIPYSAVDREVEQEILPVAQARGIGVLVMSPLGTGHLTRNSPPDRELAAFRDFGVSTWAQILLKWVVSDPRVTATIPATSKPGRMTENARAGSPPWFGPEDRERVTALARRYAA